MVVMQRVVKPRTKKAKRALEAKEPKAIEASKKALIVQGAKASGKVQQCMKELGLLKKPDVEFFNKVSEA